MPEPWKEGTTLIDGLVYPITGIADGSWTKELMKDGANVPSPPGITISNPASDTRYVVTIDGSTGFVSATGQYQLVVYPTAYPNDKFAVELTVTVDGLPSGTFGTAEFTSTTGDGRVTDGSSALQGATVYIRRSNGDMYAILTTDANGNWGPVAFDSNGTFGISVQKSGYTVGTASLTVTGGTTVTGPGADIALTANGASSTITFSALKAYARRMYHSRVGTKATTEVSQSVNDALRMCASDHDWNWFYTIGRLNFNGYYNTGTVTVTDGSPTVTLSGGTFPSWAASGEIYIQGIWCSILTRDSGTQLTLDNDWESPSTDGSGLSYTLMQNEYDLPSDCRAIVNLTPQSVWWRDNPVSRWQIDMAKQNAVIANGSATGNYMHAIERNRIVLWPYPGDDTMANILYIRVPAVLVDDADEADWDANVVEVLYRAIDYQVSIRGECVAGSSQECYERYKEALQRALGGDRSSRPRSVIWSGSSGFSGAPLIPPFGNLIQ